MTERELKDAIKFGEPIKNMPILLSCATVCLEVLKMAEETSQHEEDGQSCGCEEYSDDNPCETFMNGSNQKLREIQQLIKKGEVD